MYPGGTGGMMPCIGGNGIGGSVSAGNGSEGNGGENGIGGFGPSRLPIMLPTPGMADATLEMRDVSGPNP